MKKKVLSFIMAVVMLFSLTASPVSAAGFDAVTETVTSVLSKALGTVLELLVKGIVAPLKEGDNFVDEENYVADDFCGNIYDGTDEFLSQAVKGAKWSLGSCEASLVPENLEQFGKLYLGGYMLLENGYSNDVREVLDDMRVRVIAMNDGSGRGTAVFATIDSIGLGNPDVVAIRKNLEAFAKEKGVNSVNIFTTHTHSGIDTQGLWTDILGTWPMAFVKGYTGLGENKAGKNEEYMSFLYEKVEQAVVTAVSSMKEGTMTYAEKDLGDKYNEIGNRPSSTALDTKIRRFVFTPDDTDARPTMIINMAAHPSTVGLATDSDPTKGHGVSADYVYYMGQAINGAGYDFAFFNGAICGIYIKRLDAKQDLRVDIADNYGTELGQIALAMTMSEAEIKNDSYLMSLNLTEEETAGHSYTPWYDNWVCVPQEEVEPVLNIRLKKVEVPVTNPVIMLAAKLQVVDYLVKKSGTDYYITTEIGYMEMGERIKIALVPGELCADLAYAGASLTAEGSASGEDFSENTLSDLFGEDVIVFGMANDAIGYIVPDNDYLMCLGFGHYHETISLGKNTASELMKSFENIAD